MIQQLVIQYDTETGQLKVEGPIQDRLLSLGLLELAKVAVGQPQNASPIAKVAPGTVIPNLRLEQ